MKRLSHLCLALLCALPLAGCSTTNLVHWAQDEPSVFWEPEGEVSRGFLKPFVTIVGFPLALGWDIATFPFQLIGGVYPYGDTLMYPEDGADI